jgi:hypothetical protein
VDLAFLRAHDEQVLIVSVEVEATPTSQAWEERGGRTEGDEEVEGGGECLFEWKLRQYVLRKR